MLKAAITEEDQSTVLIPPIMSVAPWLVKDVSALPGFRLAVVFVDGTEGVVDLSGRIASSKAGVFAVLKDQSLFSKVHVEYGAVTWPGDLDLAPDAMYDAIKKDGVWTIGS